MPELPEVETIKSQLQKLIIGKKIKAVDIFLPKMVKAPLRDFKQAVLGAKIKKVGRRAKVLIIELDNGWSLINHLKMTGQMIFSKRLVANSKQLKSKHTHIIYIFSDGSRLLHNDLRQFGWVKLIKTAAVKEFLEKDYGPEPLDKNFTLKKFQEISNKKPKARIKQFLMDQKNIAGIGNIYADEILFAAGINPLRKIGALSDKEIKKAYQAIGKILSLAVKLKGTSSQDYLDAFGHEGNFAKELKVYGREGEKCVKCKSEIKRLKIGGRSAHFCPACQRLTP